jgi:hypothetical protein
MKKTAILLVISLLMAATVFAAPNLINYQGVLTDGAGNPVDGLVSFEFRLFDADIAGTQLWSETQNVSVLNGAYNVLLGSSTAFPADLFDGRNLELEIVVSGENLTPRHILASVPFARQAGCNPGDFVNCYAADPATRNVGPCRSGIRYCPETGLGFGDCTDAILPVAEVCADGIDNDCDGQVDENCAVDADGDGVDSSLDCDDTDPNNYPGNTEICDGQDNDCSGLADFPGETVDADGDGSLACMDCNDSNPANYPGNFEICDGYDNDCSGLADFPGESVDADGDGYLSCSDCNDNNGAVYPYATEVCNGIDDNCNGAVDAIEVPVSILCPSLPHATSACLGASGCILGTCDAGWANQNGIEADGCEAQL